VGPGSACAIDRDGNVMVTLAAGRRKERIAA